MSERISLRAEVPLWVLYPTFILDAKVYTPSTSCVRIYVTRQLSVGTPGFSCLEVGYTWIHKV